MQIHDFLQIYESKSDEELLVIARGIDDLTDEARAALQSELSRRGLKVFPDEKIEEEAILRVPALVVDPITSTNQFLLKVTRTYRQHFWLFIGLIVPASSLSFYVVLQIRQNAVNELVQSLLMGGNSSPLGRSEALLVMYATYFAGWTLFCVSYAGIASAVVKLASGESASIRTCFAGLLERKWLLSKAASLLFAILVSGTILRYLVTLGLYWLFPRQMSSLVGRISEYALAFLLMLVVSRLALTIPIVLYEDRGVRSAIFRSDEITEGKWTILAALIFKSVWGGYIVGLLPFWIAEWISPDVHLSAWFLSFASVAAVALVEPFMFIGFGLMYVTARQTGTSVQGQQTFAQST